jgi:hypothetical protein
MLRPLFCGSLLLALLGCGSVPGPLEQPTSPQPVRKKRNRKRGGPSIAAEVGALDAKETQAVFSAAMPAIEGCLAAGRERLSYLAGELKVLLRIASDGSVRYALPLKSTFGDLASEQCMLKALTDKSWPRPQGGREGEARQSFRIGALGRPAVAWNPHDLGRNGKRLVKALDGCRQKAGVERLAIALHIDQDGQPLAAGGSTDDPAGLAAIACGIKAAKALRYPSPGSWPAKVTIASP